MHPAISCFKCEAFYISSHAVKTLFHKYLQLKDEVLQRGKKKQSRKLTKFKISKINALVQRPLTGV